MAATPEPIAIIGLSCRFPGADSPSELWDVLKEGRQTWTDVPEDRWNWKSFYHPHPEANGAHNARGGCFLKGDISRFDAGFFNMPSPEAHAMDPQHRLQLESAYEAIENAGIPIESLRGTDTGVFMAVASRDYDRMAYKDTHDLPKYHLTGVGDPVLCGRISYVFDLKGPSFTLDTGCSGSMVCLHQAVTSLRNGESSMALVGGTHVLLGPDLTMTMSLLQYVLSYENISFHCQNALPFTRRTISSPVTLVIFPKYSHSPPIALLVIFKYSHSPPELPFFPFNTPPVDILPLT